ncbi:MAG TPA: type II secretion system F family protein [Candidatus Saccharimonadales bacterium]|nr:type II secretion system F family protein [Candidatus Saccharimonadales bacterium]
MITFEYSAKHIKSGENVKAEVQAENVQAAAKLLMSQDLFPVTIINKSDKKGLLDKFGQRVSTKDRIIFTRQLATLINAGLPLVQSLRTIKEQLSNKALQDIVQAIVSSVEGGSSLSAAFGEHPKVFNQIYVSLIAAGETSGSLDKTLERIASQQEKDAAIVSKIRSALVYPIIVLFVIVAVLVFMLTTVLPQVAQLYTDLKKPLPPLTQFLANLSGFLIKFWWLVPILLVLVGLGLRNYFKTEPGQRLLDRVKVRLPLFGRIFRKVYMARYSRTLGTLLASGIPMLEALDIVRKAINNVLLEESIERSMSQVKGGKALSTSLEDDPHFLVLVPQMIKIGEQSGAIDEMLGRVASFYEDEVDTEVKNLSTTIEPLLMVVLGVLVAFVIGAILFPVYNLVGSGGLDSAAGGAAAPKL